MLCNLYNIFNEIFEDENELKEYLKNQQRKEW
jgi:hypothetical protein